MPRTHLILGAVDLVQSRPNINGGLLERSWRIQVEILEGVEGVEDTAHVGQDILTKCLVERERL